MAQSERLKLILEGASEAWRVADEIAAAGVPVLITPVANTPASFEALGATLDNARRLTDAGVVVAIQGNGNHRSEEHTSGTPVTNAQLVCRLLLEKKNSSN